MTKKTGHLSLSVTLLVDGGVSVGGAEGRRRERERRWVGVRVGVVVEVVVVVVWASEGVVDGCGWEGKGEDGER